jgi:hypothetical protein
MQDYEPMTETFDLQEIGLKNPEENEIETIKVSKPDSGT